MGVGPTRSEAAVEPFWGPAFEPLISRGARSLVPSRGRILFGVSPFPGPCCKREKEEKRKRIRNRTTRRTFLDAVIMAKAKRRPLLLPEAPMLAFILLVVFYSKVCFLGIKDFVVVVFYSKVSK